MLTVILVGLPACGKDALAAWFVRKNYLHISTSALLRQQMAEKGITDPDRPAIRAFVKDMRTKSGNHYLGQIAGKMAREQFNEDEHNGAVISGLRNTAEVFFLGKMFQGGIIHIAIDAPVEKRYQWDQERRIRQKMPEISLDEFKQQEIAENDTDDGSHEMTKVLGMAEATVSNMGTLEDLCDKMSELLARYRLAEHK